MSAAALISAAELADKVDNPEWLVIDCRFDLMHPEAGAAAYREGHIPGAVYAHLERDLSGPITAVSGRHPLPDPQRLCETFSRWGITTATQVICYDAHSNAYAARLWWLLRWLGHARVAVLDGGLQAWEAGNYAFDIDIPQILPSSFYGEPHNTMLITTADLEARLRNDAYTLIDVRSTERYSGNNEPIDPVAGHIPGARNLPYQQNVDSDGYYLSAPVLQAMYQRQLNAVPAEHCSVMCGSGVTACQSLIALEIAGMRGAKLYAGSWSEWIREPKRPVAIGDE